MGTTRTAGTTCGDLCQAPRVLCQAPSRGLCPAKGASTTPRPCSSRGTSAPRKLPSWEHSFRGEPEEWTQGWTTRERVRDEPRHSNQQPGETLGALGGGEQQGRLRWPGGGSGEPQGQGQEGAGQEKSPDRGSGSRGGCEIRRCCRPPSQAPFLPRVPLPPP